MKYEKKVIAYIDLLGFKSFINFTDKSANSKETKIQYVNNLFQLLKEFTENKSYSATKSRTVTQFSDLIVISFESNDFESFYDEIRDIQLLCVNCVNKGFLLRGSIIYGEIVHSNDIIFGPGLVEAHESEKSQAKYPRIIVDEIIIKDFRDTKPGIFNISEVISIDKDGFYYVDYFSKVKSSLDDPIKEYDTYIQNLAQIIYNMYESPKLKEKASWLFTKFKPMLANYPLFSGEDFDEYELTDISHLIMTLKD